MIPAFHALIPPLRPEERSLLKQSILKDGCLDALKLWRGVLLDGYHRLAICRLHKIPFETAEVPNLSCRQDAIEWIYENQLSRRNLSEPAFTYYLGKTYEAQKRRVGQHGALNGDRLSRFNRTAADLADLYDVDERTVFRAAEFARNVDTILATDPSAIVRLLDGDIGLTHDEVKHIAKLPKPERRVAADYIAGFSSGPDALREAARDSRKARNASKAAMQAKELAGWHF